MTLKSGEQEAVFEMPFLARAFGRSPERYVFSAQELQEFSHELGQKLHAMEELEDSSVDHQHTVFDIRMALKAVDETMKQMDAAAVAANTCTLRM